MQYESRSSCLRSSLWSPSRSAFGLSLPLGAAILAASCGSAMAQPTNVRAWYAQGQVFVVWERPAPPATPLDTVEIYSSVAAQVNTANMNRIGRLFFPEYTGARLQALVPNARLLLPGPGGGTYRLAPNEGAFAYTPHAAGNLFFAVVDSGSTVVNAANSVATAFAYDPVNDPVRPHPQFSGNTPGGQPYTAYVVWADGRVDPDDARPDIPVLAAESKNGVPHVFTITSPAGPLPPAPLSCLFALHGGEGEYQLFRPGVAARGNMQLNLSDGIVITPDDSIYNNINGVLTRTNTSWFGYVSDLDPFSNLPRVNPPDTSIVVSYTSRRVFWILDWLLRPTSPLTIDPTRVAIVGHSGGGRGTSTISRQAPERFCAAVAQTPASDLPTSGTGVENFLRGDFVQNLDTNISRNGITLGTTEVFEVGNPIAPSGARDLTLTRYYWGKRDQEGAASWTTSQRAVLDRINDSRLGGIVSWDEREHGVEKWDNETPDFNDGNPDPWPDVGQWVAPVRSRRYAAQYLVDTYRSNRSYPGFFNADSDASLAGRQPDPGPGDPSLGDPYGTWEGYFEFTEVVDEPGRWAATLFATGLSAVSIDNAPVAQFTTDLAPRKTANFNPPRGTPCFWFATDRVSNATLQTGSTTAETDGVVVVAGLTIPRDPARVRLTIVACPADFNRDGQVDFFDYLDFALAYSTDDPTADFNRDGQVDFFDYLDFALAFSSGCP
ncbi:MAG: prolyl oligopeptidase family serine peptidase [Planctomycetota bacterium]|nr:prolyl oligopeptidase family serine peptidase [Planctomycetota bacterium]